ncbi:MULTISPECIES: hypothetical protein [Paenibacillus]|uniref:hypothetical protein n=1 Tax=Paenibacillus TaxID=44249 RepID=UPI003D29AB26
MFVKIRNLTKNGQADYKGMNISRFVPGSQAYALDKGDNYCVLETLGEVVPDHPDVFILSAEKYEQERAEIFARMPTVKNPLEDLRKENEAIKSNNLLAMEALADTFETMLSLQDTLLSVQAEIETIKNETGA